MTTQAARYYRGAAQSSAESNFQLFSQSKDETITFTDFATIYKITNTLSFTHEQFEQLQEFYSSTIGNLKAKHICNHCGEVYTLWKDAGMRGCKTHLGSLVQGVWQCCKANQFHGSLSPFVKQKVRKPMLDPKNGFLNSNGKRTKKRKREEDEDDSYFIYESVPSFEPASVIMGCIESDHRITGEEKSISPTQIDAIYTTFNRRLPMSVTWDIVGELQVPRKLSRTSYLELPLLVFVQMPRYQMRPILKVVYKPSKQILIAQNRQWDANMLFSSSKHLSLQGLHPFPESPHLTQLQVGDYLIDVVDTFVYIARVDE